MEDILLRLRNLTTSARGRVGVGRKSVARGQAAAERRRVMLLATASAMSGWLGAGATVARADESVQASQAQQGQTVSEITVTGSRIVQDGYRAPTPLNVLGAADIQAQRPNNLADLVNTMPAATGVTLTAANSSGNVSGGTAGVATVNLRGLGAGRTLVLIDGRRTAPSTFSGLVDINTIPQDLVERVEIVTGGASAQYGSDAVAGVINFILNTKFKGLKVGAETGVTRYGDGANYRFSAAAGRSFLDDRLHVLLDADYFHQNGIDNIKHRSWNDSGYALTLNPAYNATNGQPQYLVGSNTGVARTLGGLINSGPLQGTYFLAPGVTGAFNYGAGNAVSAPWILGGDWQLSRVGVNGTDGLQPTEDRMGVFNRIAFDVSPDVTVFGQFSWNKYEEKSFFSAYPSDTVIASDNAYLLTQYPQVAAAMAANGLNNISISSWNPGVPSIGTDNTRQAFRYLVGAQGNFLWLDRKWSWNAYYQRGVTKTRVQTTGNWLTSNLALATDAVLANGQIVCRSTLTDPTNGCVPMDRIGVGSPSAAALNYIHGAEQPWRIDTITQDAVSGTLNGQLFELPGGPAAIALGGEWRKDQDHSRIGMDTGWQLANYKPNSGEISVKEGFVEVGLPLFTGFNFDAAGRYTDYSTAGVAKTWKLGATYAPINDLKFRSSYSHDIRAPNMSELFAGSSGSRVGVVLPANSPAPGLYNVVVNSSGNPSLRPETANTWTAGVVITPDFLPGFSASVDYYDINLEGAIGSVSPQQNVDFCYGGFSQFCSNLVFTGGTLTAIAQKPINFARQHATGIDFEATYATPLSAISENLPGNLRIHAEATHYIKNVVDNRIFPIDGAGVIDDGDFGDPSDTPHWVYRVSAFYDLDPVSVNLVARGFSSGVYGNNYVGCSAACPTSTVQNPTINNNHIDGAIYFDASFGLKLENMPGDTRVNLIISNIFNKSPTLIGFDTSGFSLGYPQTARPLYDTLGRVFKASITSKF